MKARLLLFGYALSVLPAFAMPITHVEPGQGNAGPLILAQAADDTQARLDWIHKNAPHCCNHKDCGPHALTITPKGWQADGADNVVPFEQTIQWPFSGPWACVINRHARCVLAQGGG